MRLDLHRVLDFDLGTSSSEPASVSAAAAVAILAGRQRVSFTCYHIVCDIDMRGCIGLGKHAVAFDLRKTEGASAACK